LPSPLDGRKLWIAGIGGAGMSAYALLARAWGAEVRGWDRTHTPYLEQLAGIDVEISEEVPSPPSGWEPFVSTAFAGRVAGKSRAALLAELVSLRDSIVVAGSVGLMFVPAACIVVLPHRAIATAATLKARPVGSASAHAAIGIGENQRSATTRSKAPA